MNESKKLNILIDLLIEIKENLDTECCQTLMDADSISAKIERVLKEINN